MECDSIELRTLYAETRLMEKKVGVARVQLEQAYEQVKEQLMQLAERKLQAVRRLQKSAVTQLSSIHDILSSTAWDNFKRYAQEVRKVHLGGSKLSSLPSFKKQAVMDYLQSLQTARTRCEAILNHYSKQFGLEIEGSLIEPSRELSFNAVTSQSERLLHKLRTEPSFEISPIKRKQDLPEKDTCVAHIVHNQPIPTASPLQNKVDSTSLLLPQPSTRIALKQSYNPLTSPPLTSIVPPLPTTSTPTSLRAPPLASPGRNPSSKLSKVRSQGKLGSSKGVLELLQLQQVRFDKLKHGLL